MEIEQVNTMKTPKKGSKKKFIGNDASRFIPSYYKDYESEGQTPSELSSLPRTEIVSKSRETSMANSYPENYRDSSYQDTTLTYDLTYKEGIKMPQESKIGVEPQTFELRISHSLQNLMDTVNDPDNITNRFKQSSSKSKLPYILTSSLMALVVRQNLGSTLTEIQKTLDQARQEYFRLLRELTALDDADPKKETIQVELKVLDETVRTLEFALERAEKEHNEILNIQEDLEVSKEQVRMLEDSLRSVQTKASQLETMILTKNSQEKKGLNELSITMGEEVKMTCQKRNGNANYKKHDQSSLTSQSELDKRPSAGLIRWLLSTLVLFILLLLLVVVFAESCRLLPAIRFSV